MQEHLERKDENQERERLWSTSGRKLLDKEGMIHIKGGPQAGMEVSECARNNNCALAHALFLPPPRSTVPFFMFRLQGRDLSLLPVKQFKQLLAICTENINWMSTPACS